MTGPGYLSAQAGGITPAAPPVRPGVARPVTPSVGQLAAPVPPCPPQTHFGQPIRDTNRRIWVPEIAGMFEALNSHMTVQLSTAGHAIVGWFALPPGAIGVSPQSWPQPRVALRCTAGAFIVDTRSTTSPDEYKMFWVTGPGGPGDPNTMDPQLVLEAFSVGPPPRQGTFKIVDRSRPSVEIELRFDPASNSPDKFKRYRASVRLPSSAIKGVCDPKARDLLLVEHVQPLAPNWIAEIVERISGPTLQQAVKDWQEATSPSPARANRRYAVASQLKVVELEPNFLPPLHRRALLTRLIAVLKDTRLTVGTQPDDITHSLWDWYDEIAAEDRQQATYPLQDNFTRLGFETSMAKGFAYVVSYLKAKAEYKLLVKGALAGFSMRVHKIPVEFVLKANGARKVDADGKPELVDPKVLDDPKAGTWFGGDDDLLLGAFLDAGVGLGYSLDSGRSLTKAATASSATLKESGGDSLGDVVFYSSVDIKESREFDGAWFAIVPVKGPAIKAGNFGGFTGFATTFHQFWLTNNKELDAVASKIMKFSPPQGPTWNLAFGGADAIKSYWDGWTRGKASLTVFELSMGFGYITHVPSRSRASDTSTSPGTDRSPVKGAENNVVFFALDSAALRVPPFDGVSTEMHLDGRYALEVFLATMRSLLLAGPESRIRIDGYASPEHPRCYNEGLSLARADSVEAATRDAFGAAITGRGAPIFLQAGQGELAALRSGTGLHDPPDDPAGRAAFEKAHPDQVAQWPKWRKAEISVQGSVVVVGRTATPLPFGG